MRKSIFLTLLCLLGIGAMQTAQAAYEIYGVLSEDGKTYVAILDINDVLSTIIPVNIACESSTREVRFVSKIKVDGSIHRTKFKDVKRNQVDKVTLYDNQNEEIEAMTICIDCLLVLLDTLDQLINGDYRDDVHGEIQNA